MKTFIRLAEVWVPSADGNLLELAEGLFDNAPAFGAMSKGMCFGRAEGLPGRAWDEGRPLLLRQLEGSYFRRAAAGRAEGLTSALALPLYRAGALTCVVVLMFGTLQSHSGAVELWHNDSTKGPDLYLQDGYFGTAAPVLEALTRAATLPKGSGVPGLAWKSHCAVFIADIEGSRHFVRGPQAAGAGIVRALAWPCEVPSHETWVLNLLSSASTPLARRVEVWRSNPAGTHLQRLTGHCEVSGPLAAGSAVHWPVASLGALGDAWTTGRARAASGGAVHAGLDAQQAAAAGLHSLLAIPVAPGESPGEVVCFYF